MSLRTSSQPAGISVPFTRHEGTSRATRLRQWRLFVATLVLNDVVLSGVAFVTATWIRTSVPLPIFNLDARPTIPPVAVIAFILIPLWISIFASQGLYRRQNLLGGLQEYPLVLRATGIGILMIVIIGFIQPPITPARGWLLLVWIFAAALVTTGRFLLRRGVYWLRGRGHFLSPALVVGYNGEAHSLAEQLLVWRTSGLRLLGFVAEQEAHLGQPAANGLPVLGHLDDLDHLVAHYAIEELVVATSALSQGQILSIFKRYGVQDTINLRLSSGLFEVVSTGMVVKEIASVPLVQINPVRLTGYEQAMKNLFDIVVAVPLLILNLPLMGAIAIAIKLDSPGPVIYRRRVMGLNGSEFEGFKFRTMDIRGDEILDANPSLKQELETTHKLKNDPRVTKAGRFLRKYSLDELPQLFNVLMRQMSIVGPRMIAPHELAMYEKWDLNLLTVRPGITGLWQVSGRSDVSYAERVQLDMRYIRNWSIWLEIQILMQTVMVVIRGKGAY